MKQGCLSLLQRACRDDETKSYFEVPQRPYSQRADLAYKNFSIISTPKDCIVTLEDGNLDPSLQILY